MGKGLTGILVALAIWLTLVLLRQGIGPAVEAGDYHAGASLHCAECHVMHPSPSTGERVEGTARAEQAGELLRKDVNDLCLGCHDDSPRATDVLGRNLGRYPSDVRQAGALNRLGRAGIASSGHTLDSFAVAPGSDPPWRAEDENGPGRGLSCVNCHAPHGHAEALSIYRNLRDDAGNNQAGAGRVTSSEAGRNDLSRDVFVRRARRYDESDVDFNQPDPLDPAIARFCAGCHDRFHGPPGDEETVGGSPAAGNRFAGFIRHPSGGVAIGALGGEHSSLALFNSHRNRVKVTSAAGKWSPAGADSSPTCITCHKAHGNGNPFGLIYRSGRGARTEEGDAGGTRLEHLCGQCHEQASPFVES